MSLQLMVLLSTVTFAPAAAARQTINKKSRHIIFLRYFTSHGDQMFPVRRIAADRAVERMYIGDRRFIGRLRLPIRMQAGFLLRNTAVEISIDFDVVLGARSDQFAEQIEFQAVMPDADGGIVISHALIAAYRKTYKINIVAGEALRKGIGIKVLADVFQYRTGMKIIK